MTSYHHSVTSDITCHFFTNCSWIEFMEYLELKRLQIFWFQVELAKEGCIETALWVEATAPVVRDVVLEFGEQTGLAIYQFGELSLEVTSVYGGIAFEAICYASTVALENGQILLEVSFDAASGIAVIIVEWVKEGFSSETIDKIQEILETLLKNGHRMLKASFSNGEEYRILSSTLNNIVGVNDNPRLFSGLIKTR